MRVRSCRDDGFTLIELMVAMVLLGAIGTATLSTLTRVQATVAGTTARNADLGEARVAANAAERWLRAAVPPAETATPFEVTTAARTVFYSAAGSAVGQRPRRVELVVGTDNVLLERVTDPVQVSGVWSYTGTPRERTLATALTSTNVFRFFCSDADPLLTCPAGQEATAHSVGIRVGVRGAGADRAESALETRVRIVNNDLR